MHLPPQSFQPYASPLTPSSASNAYPSTGGGGYVTHGGAQVPAQAPFSAAPATMMSGAPQLPSRRMMSAESSNIQLSGDVTHAGVHQFSTDLPAGGPAVWPGQPGLGQAVQYQPHLLPAVAGPPLAGIGQPAIGFSQTTSASAGSQGPFTFHPAAPGRSVPPAPTQEASSSTVTGGSASPDAASGPLPQMPLLQPAPAFTPTATPANTEDRAAVRSQLCKQAFQFVDALRTGHIDISQNKTALTMVFDQLGVPMPKDEWYGRVFRNFVGNEQDLIDYKGFKEVVRQWDEHHRKKREKRQTQPLQPQSQSSRSTQLPQPPQQPVPTVSASADGSSAQSARCLPSEQDASSAIMVTTAGLEAAPPDEVASERERDEVQPHASLSCSFPGIAQTREQGSTPATNSSKNSAAALGTSSAGATEAGEDAELTRSSSTLTRRSAANIASEVMFPTYVGRLAIFDDYEFFGDVGSGSFGKVMVVRHRMTKQLRACKVVAVQTALQRELIDTEIRLLKSLNHPNIMKMHEVYFEQAKENGQITNGNIYLVTELCEGGDLFSRILHHYERLKQPMTESHVAYMMQQILSATKYCHDKGIIHRDIKPENILFVDRSSSSPLKIIDFGLADFHEKIREQAKEVKVSRSGTMGRLARMLPSVNGRHLIPWHERKRVMQKAGTPHYMSPEMIEGSYDHKTDLFSIGIILCQLFTGWHPFYTPGDDEQAVRAKILQPEPVQFPKDIWQPVSEDAADLCRKLLEKSPKNRPSASQALTHPWFLDPSKPSPFGNVEGLSVSIFDGLMQYQAYNKLKRAVLQLLTRELSEFQIQELRGKFMALDKQGDGLLSAEELVEGMRHVGYRMSQDELQQIVAALDGTGTQRIGYKEFISALIERRVKFDRQQLFECFKKFDKQGIGKITYEDVKSVMCNAITQSEWQEIAEVGAQQDPKQMPELTFDEFVALMEHDPDS
eukprot:TRINITY_DN40032_c0_g1_i1.p1 TRINITY_DN40032_c0_g1~~TRINITY_DN40032_c0_g1_i1.p1  ORF type:complete len:957 (+),score=179.99 TRINITY_DN40032_c0_g1_i1:101-2971(+)